MRTPDDVRRTLAAALGALAALTVLAPGASAQGGHGHGKTPHHDEMRGGHGGMSGGAHGRMMGRPGAALAHVPTAILHQSDLLELSDDQVARVEALRDSVRAIHEGRRSAMGESRGAFREAFGPDGLDVDAYREAVRSAADRMVEARVRTARAAREALGVLTDAQREKFLFGLRLMRRGHGGERGGHGEMGPHRRDGGQGATEHDHSRSDGAPRR